MHRKRWASGLISMAIVAGFASAASAQLLSGPGNASVAGTYKFKLSGCGKDRGSSSEFVAIGSGGAWSEDGNTRTGTATQPGPRMLTISYDAATLQLIQGAFVGLAESTCAAEFAVTSFQFSATAKFNKRLSNVTIRKTVNLSGTTAGGSHTGGGSQKEKGSWYQVPV